MLRVVGYELSGGRNYEFMQVGLGYNVFEVLEVLTTLLSRKP